MSNYNYIRKKCMPLFFFKTKIAMDFIKNRLNKPDELKRIIYITYCGRFCIGWYINDCFFEYGTNIKTKNDMVLYWQYEHNFIPNDFKEEQKLCGW